MHRFAPSRVVGTDDRAVAQSAAGQHGVVEHGQLAALGLDAEAVAWRLRSHRLHRMHRGVYLVGHAVAPPRARELGAQLACEPLAIVSHRSAARLWGLLPAPGVGDVVDITVVRREVHPQPGIRIHRRRRMRTADSVWQGRIRLTTVARTLFDLASVLSSGQLESIVAQARRMELTSEAELGAQLSANRGQRGVARFRQVLGVDGAPAFTRSEAERRLLGLIRASDLPLPAANSVVHGFEVDFLWARELVVVEVDSRAFHSDRNAFERDRLRDAELIANGYVVIRVTWSQLTQTPAAIINRIRRTLTTRQ